MRSALVGRLGLRKHVMKHSLAERTLRMTVHTKVLARTASCDCNAQPSYQR